MIIDKVKSIYPEGERYEARILLREYLESEYFSRNILQIFLDKKNI